KFPTGGVRSVKGALPIALRAKAEGKIGLLVPKDNAAEAAVVNGLQVIPIQNLREAVGFLEGEVKISPTRVDLARVFDQPREDELDFADVKGQESVKRGTNLSGLDLSSWARFWSFHRTAGSSERCEHYNSVVKSFRASSPSRRVSTGRTVPRNTWLTSTFT